MTGAAGDACIRMLCWTCGGLLLTSGECWKQESDVSPFFWRPNQPSIFAVQDGREQFLQLSELYGCMCSHPLGRCFRQALCVWLLWTVCLAAFLPRAVAAFSCVAANFAKFSVRAALFWSGMVHRVAHHVFL